MATKKKRATKRRVARAKTKHRSRRGLGAPPGAHAADARMWNSSAAVNVASVERHLEAGDCARAYISLIDGAHDVAVATTHAYASEGAVSSRIVSTAFQRAEMNFRKKCAVVFGLKPGFSGAHKTKKRSR